MKLSTSLLVNTTLIGLLTLSPAFAKHSSPISSAEIGSLASIAAIDKTEILAGILANHKNTASNVNDFANTMIDQHGNNFTQILEIANNHSLSGGASEKLKAQGKKELLKLGSLKGNEFEKAYVDAMVTGHEAALKLIDTQLIKTAKSEEIKKFLTETRATVATHLEHAKKLQEELKA